MSITRDSDLAIRAELRHGIFTRSDVERSGVPHATVSLRAAQGRYRRMYPSVFAVSGAPTTMMQRLAALVASFPHLAALSHQTAAELWGLTRRGLRKVEVVTTRWDRVRRSDATVHESKDLVAGDVVELEGIAVTTPVRTVVDLGASNKWAVEEALETGLRRELFSLGDVEGFVARVARRGRRGVGVIRPLLEERRRWASVTDSMLEDRFRKLVTEFRLPEPLGQYDVRDPVGGLVCRADFAYPEAGLLIELDGEANHTDRVAFQNDRRKQNRAIVLGWTVLRYTWRDVTERPTAVIHEIRAALFG